MTDSTTNFPPNDSWEQVKRPRRSKAARPSLNVGPRKFQFNVISSQYLRTGYATIHLAGSFLAFKPSGNGVNSYRVAKRSGSGQRVCTIPLAVVNAGLLRGTYLGRWNDEIGQLEFQVKFNSAMVEDQPYA